MHFSQKSCLAACLVLLVNTAWANPAVKKAADQFVGGVAWQAQSVLTADFSCAGKTEHAILGTSDKEIVVAIFTPDLKRAPEVLRFEAGGRKPEAAKIRLEDSSLTPAEITTLAGSAPTGYKPSKTCKGVRLSDDASDAAHIYWDHDSKKFDSWAQ